MNWIFYGVIFGGISVVVGVFGVYVLSSCLELVMFNVFEVGVCY